MDAQDPITIGDAVACGDCSIELVPLVTLRSPETATLLSLPSISVARNVNGFFFAGPLIGDTVIGIYNPTGEHARSWGRVGHGPGELPGYPNELFLRVAAGDERVTALQGTRLVTIQQDRAEPIRESRVPLRVSDLAVTGGGTVAQATVFSSSGAGTPLQLLRDDGGTAQGIGIVPGRPLSRSASAFESVRRIAPGGDAQSVWSSHINRYDFSRFDLAGRQEVHVVRESDWFEPYDDLIAGELFVVPQRPRVVGIREDDEGLVWVLITEGKPDMTPLVDLEATPEAAIGGDVDFAKYVTTTIEVLDLNEARVVVRQTVDADLRFASDGQGKVLVHSLTYDDSGDAVIHVYAAMVVSGSG